MVMPRSWRSRVSEVEATITSAIGWKPAPDAVGEGRFDYLAPRRGPCRVGAVVHVETGRVVVGITETHGREVRVTAQRSLPDLDDVVELVGLGGGGQGSAGAAPRAMARVFLFMCSLIDVMGWQMKQGISNFVYDI